MARSAHCGITLRAIRGIELTTADDEIIASPTIE
jgi:hypothetical protein